MQLSFNRTTSVPNYCFEAIKKFGKYISAVTFFHTPQLYNKYIRAELLSWREVKLLFIDIIK